MNWEGLSVLITGGLGMIGSTIARKLVQMGASVTIIDAMYPLYGGNLFNLEPYAHHVTVHVADIRDESAVRYLVRDKTFIFNLAAQVSYTDSVIDPYLDLDINCRGHLVLLEACRQQNLKPKIVFSSSRMVYGKTLVCPVDENHRTEPLMPYAIHKLAGEKYHMMYCNNFDIPCSIARIANPYGPRQQMKHSKYGIVNWFMRQAIEGNPIRIFGDGIQKRDYIYVDDIADALIALAESSETTGQTFNVGSGIGTTFSEMVRSIIDVVGNGSLEYIPWPENYASVETGDYISDLTKIRSKTGWAPQISFVDGIRQTFVYYSQYRMQYW